MQFVLQVFAKDEKLKRFFRIVSTAKDRKGVEFVSTLEGIASCCAGVVFSCVACCTVMCCAVLCCCVWCVVWCACVVWRRCVCNVWFSGLVWCAVVLCCVACVLW